MLSMNTPVRTKLACIVIHMSCPTWLWPYERNSDDDVLYLFEGREAGTGRAKI